MSQSYRFLHIDTRLKTYGESNDFRIKIEPALRQLKGCKLVALNLPLTNYTINDSNNIIYINDGVNTYNAVVTPGVYTYINILPAIKTAIEGSGYGGIITATFSDLTYKITIAGTVNFSLEFGTNTINSMAGMLGFNNVDTISSASHTGNNAINLSVPPCIFIKINEFPIMCKSSNGISGTFPIYLNVISGEINFHFAKTHYELESTSTLSNINSLSVSLIDPLDGRLINMEGVNWGMLLELY